MKKIIKVFCIVIAAVLIMGTVLVGCGEKADDKKTLQFKANMPEELDFNVAFDVEEYVDYEEGESLKLEAKYSENGTEKTYLVAGLTFIPTTLNDVTITVSYKDDAETKISKTLKIKIPAPNMTTITSLEMKQGDKLVFADLLDKEKYPNFNYTSLAPVTIKATKVILPNGTETAFAEGTTEYTFEEGGQYSIGFELSNSGGVYSGMMTVNVATVLPANEVNDLTNNQDGNGPVLTSGSGTLQKVEEARENSDWYYSYTAKPDTNFNVHDYFRWGNYFEIYFKDNVDLTKNNVEFDLQTTGNSAYAVFVLFIDDIGNMVGEFDLKTTTRNWEHAIVTEKSLTTTYNGSKEAVKRIRIGIAPAEECREENGQFPSSIDNIVVNFDNMTVVSNVIPANEVGDLTNNQDGTGPVLASGTGTIQKVEEARENSSWYYSYTAKPDTNFNVHDYYRWGNYIEVYFEAPVDLTQNNIEFDLQTTENSAYAVFVLLIDNAGTMVGEFDLKTTTRNWEHAIVTEKSLTTNYTGSKEEVKRIRIGIAPAEECREESGQFPATIDNIVVNFDNMTVVSNGIPANEVGDLTNNQDGTGPVLASGTGTIQKVEEVRENSSWYYSYTAKPDTDFNNFELFRWGNYIEIYFEEPVDLTLNNIEFDLQTAGNSAYAVFVMFIDNAGTMVGEFTLNTSSQNWEHAIVTADSLTTNYTGSKEAVKRMRIGIAPAEECREESGQFPATIDNIVVNFDNMTVVAAE